MVFYNLNLKIQDSFGHIENLKKNLKLRTLHPMINIRKILKIFLKNIPIDLIYST